MQKNQTLVSPVNDISKNRGRKDFRMRPRKSTTHKKRYSQVRKVILHFIFLKAALYVQKLFNSSCSPAFNLLLLYSISQNHEAYSGRQIQNGLSPYTYTIAKKKKSKKKEGAR
uniref:Uncharacterized protein n=1 Tax=Micrurus corallinus TaxID=54390 RepID=A0A2D4FJA8_MICCO